LKRPPPELIAGQVDVQKLTSRADPVKPMAVALDDGAKHFAPEQLVDYRRNGGAMSRTRRRTIESLRGGVRLKRLLEALPQRFKSRKERVPVQGVHRTRASSTLHSSSYV
jgi:hypothetical protein